MKGNLSKLLN